MYTGCWQSLGDVYSVGGSGDVHRVLEVYGMYIGCWWPLGDVYRSRVLGGSGGCTKGVGSLLGMYTGCLMSMTDVLWVLEVYGGCIQSVRGVWGTSKINYF